MSERGKATIELLNLNRSQLVEQRRLELLEKRYFEEYKATQPDTLKVFLDSMGTIRRLNSANIGDVGSDRQSLTNMLYANVITTMETYLSDAFISKIKSKKQFLRSFVETFHDFKKEKFELRDIFTYYEEIEEKAIKAMKDVICHDLPKVSGMYRDTLGVEFLALSNLYKSVLVRHDLVHRNGKTISGEFHEINRGDVRQLCNQIESFVRDVESKLKAI